MKKVAVISETSCDKSPMCPAMRMCPAKAVLKRKESIIGGFLGFGTAYVNEELCTGCGACVNYCPAGAIKMKKR